MIYTSKNEYIGQIIEPALKEWAAEHDIDAIADEMLVWHNDVNSLGNNGFLEDESKDFWSVVEAHAV